MTTVPVIGGSTSVVSSTSVKTQNLPYPSGILSGDILLLFAANTEGGALYTVPTGFTSDYNIEYIPYASKNTSAGNDLDGFAAHKIATGTESGNATVAWATASTGISVMVRITGVPATGAIVSNAQTQSPQGTTAYASAPSPLNVTSPGPNNMVIRAYMFGQDNAGNSAATGAIGSVSGWTNLQSVASVATSSSLYNCGLSVNYLQGAVTAPTVSCTTQSGAWMVVEYNIQGLFSAAGLLPFFGMGHHEDELTTRRHERRRSGLYVPRRRELLRAA